MAESLLCSPETITKLLIGWVSVKNPPTNAEDADAGSIPGSERSPGEENGNPLQYSCLEKSMDRVAWPATVHGVTKESRHDFATK